MDGSHEATRGGTWRPASHACDSGRKERSDNGPKEAGQQSAEPKVITNKEQRTGDNRSGVKKTGPKGGDITELSPSR